MRILNGAYKKRKATDMVIEREKERKQTAETHSPELKNIPKSGLTSGTWAGTTDDPKAMGFNADMTPMTIERVERKPSGEAQLETFISKTGYEVQNYTQMIL